MIREIRKVVGAGAGAVEIAAPSPSSCSHHHLMLFSLLLELSEMGCCGNAAIVAREEMMLSHDC